MQHTLNAQLVEPNLKYKESYLEALAEYPEDERTPSGFENPERDFEQFIAFLENDRTVETDTLVPSFQYWCVVGDRYIGRINYRPKLNEFLRFHGGNVGYSVRPSERKKGYATLMLSEIVEKAKQDGHAELLLTCDTDNIASIKVIEKCGGRYDSACVDQAGTTAISRYIIKLR